MQYLSDITNSITEIPEVGVQLPECSVTYHLYMTGYAVCRIVLSLVYDRICSVYDSITGVYESVDRCVCR